MKSTPRRRSDKPTRTSDPGTRARARLILRRLRKEFPGAVTALNHKNPFQLLIATILSAQCTDERVNMVTPVLFAAYPDAATLADAPRAAIEDIVRSTGFYRNKAASITTCSRALVERHGGQVPNTMEELVALPGVGRKTANVVLGQAFNIPSGVVVDTHVHRLARRMGLTVADDPENIEQDLMDLYDRREWIDVGSILILHGRKTCGARKPTCAACAVNDLCPSADHYRSTAPVKKR